MRHLIVIFSILYSQCQSFPIPSGQIIKYRVSSKYFNRQNETSSDNSLYQLLSQIHYGPKEAPVTIASEQVTTILEDDNKDHNDVTTIINSITNEYPETAEDDVPATTTEQPMDVVKVNSDINDVGNNNIETDLIEKVGEEELATEADLVVTTEAANSNDDSPIELTTISDAVDPIESVTTENNKVTDDEKVSDEEEDESKVPSSLLSAVSDLLSSVLGININTIEEGDHKELQEEPSEAPITLESTVSGADDHNPTSELVAPVVNEVDLKIENLANAETSFVTENTPETYAEQSDDTVKEQSDVKDESDDDKIVLETLSELSAINDDGDEEPVSFEDSVNHVMNLVRGTEGKLAMEAAQNVVDSILIDRHMEDSVGDLDQIVYGTLKEIETNLGLSEETEDKNLPIDHEREEMIKNFETDINESLRLSNPDDYESLDLEPNPAKAAMFYKYQYGDDF